MRPDSVSASRRYLMLIAGLLAQMAGMMWSSGVALLIPALQQQWHLSLAHAGLVVSAAQLGTVVALLPWGFVVDRIGERWVLVTGLSWLTVVGCVATTNRSVLGLAVLAFLGGMAGASANAASGRVVVGWFPPERRGFVMGIRQTAQPLGVGAAAITMPAIALHHGIGTALIVPTVFAAAAGVLCLAVIVDPPRPARAAADPAMTRNPYRGSALLPRIHAVSVLLVVPQYVVWTYMLVWLINEKGWSAGTAGLLVTVAQVLGAAGRLVVGVWSDRVGSRTGPLRKVAVASALAMALLGLTDWWHSPAAIALMVAATVISVADNGLAFTAVAEISGPFWSGRALGAQNTCQSLTASFVPPLAAELIASIGYPGCFAVAAFFPAVAIGLVPVYLMNRGPNAPDQVSPVAEPSLTRDPPG
jgi:MFS family permease